MATIILLNKPFHVLCQFTDNQGRATLADIINANNLSRHYPAGRLDYDSEGLVLLTNNGNIQHRISHPQKKMPKMYWVQVEGVISDHELALLRQGIDLKDGPTKPAIVKKIKAPQLWDRIPPIRSRPNTPTSWIEISLSEGRNRQVRRMTAAVGFPTLRLIRCQIGPWKIANLQPGEYREETIHIPKASGKRSLTKETTKRSQNDNKD